MSRLKAARLWLDALALAACVGGAARNADAQVDMNGPWVALVLNGPFVFDCSLTFVQAGASLTIAGSCSDGPIGAVTVSGTIDPMAGTFDAAGSGGSLCPTLALSNGAAELDGTFFQVTYACSGGPSVVEGNLLGFRCGNGVIDASVGEECDDGNRMTHDCCDGACQYETTGTVCINDFNPCTNDLCDGVGTCTHAERTGLCSDGNQCTTGDTCIDGECVGTALPDGSACDDSNTCTSESCQGGTCVATNLPDATPCDDGRACTSGDACSAGTCLGDDVVCPACMRCFDFLGGCVTEPPFFCDAGARDKIVLKDADVDVGRWKWVTSAPLAPADFGDPVTSTSYEFCVVEPGANIAQNQLVLGAALPAGSSWKATKNGFRFRSPDNKLNVLLRSGDAGEGKVVVRVKGPPHEVQGLPLLEPLEVFLRTQVGVSPFVCMTGIYDTPIKSTAKNYKAANPPP